MGIHHDMMLCSFLYYIEIVVVHRLRVVMVTTRDDISHIPSLNGIVAILIHQGECILKMTLVVLSRT